MNERIGIDIGTVAPAGQPWSDQSDSDIEATKATPARPSRIALLAHCGTGNLGDEGSIAAVLDNVTRRWPGASIVGLSMDPEDTTRRHGIPAFAMRRRIFPFQREWSSTPRSSGPGGFAERLKALARKTGPLFRIGNALRHALFVRPIQFIREVLFLGRSLILLCELDMLVVCGGGQLLDWGGPWAFPYTLFKWLFLAKCLNVRCIVLNSGAGPLDAPLSRWFARRTLDLADYVSLRDSESGDLLRKIGFRGKMKVVADAVWNLRLPDHARKAARDERAEAERVIGIAPMAYGDSSRYWVDDGQSYRRLIDNLAGFCERMLERGYRVKLFSSDIWFDSQAIADLDAAIRAKNPGLAPDRVMPEAVCDIDDLLSALSGLDCYVTCRFHGVVFASLQNVPAIALSPHPKVSNLMAALGLSEYCVDIARCDAEDLTARTDQLLANAAEIKARIEQTVSGFRVQLTEQFDELFPDYDGLNGRKSK